MAQPNYKLKNDHVATCGHVRSLYGKVIDEFRTKADSYDKGYVDEKLGEKLNKNGTTPITGTLFYSSGPIITGN